MKSLLRNLLCSVPQDSLLGVPSTWLVEIHKEATTVPDSVPLLEFPAEPKSRHGQAVSALLSPADAWFLPLSHPRLRLSASAPV